MINKISAFEILGELSKYWKSFKSSPSADWQSATRPCWAAISAQRLGRAQPRCDLRSALNLARVSESKTISFILFLKYLRISKQTKILRYILVSEFFQNFLEYCNSAAPKDEPPLTTTSICAKCYISVITQTFHWHFAKGVTLISLMIFRNQWIL